MKTLLKTGVFAAALLGLSSGAALAQDYSQSDMRAGLAAMGLDASDARYADGAWVFADLIGEASEGEVQGNIRFFGPRTAADGTVLIDRIVMDGFMFETPGPEEMSFERIILDAPNAELADDIALILRSLSSGTEPDEAELNWADYRFGGFAVEGLTVDVPDEAQFSIERMEVAGWTDERIGRIGVDGFTLTGTAPIDGQGEQNLLFSFDEFAIEGAWTAPWAGMFANGGPDMLGMENMAGMMDGVLEFALGKYDRIVLRDLELAAGDLFSMTVALGQSTARLEDGVFHQDTVYEGMAMDLDLTNPELAPALAFFDAIGSDRIELSSAGSSAYDPATDRWWTTADSYLEWNGVMRMAADVDIAGYAAYQRASIMASMGGYLAPEQSAAAEMAALMELTINNFSFSVTDFRLIDAIASIQAQQQGLDAATVRQGYAGMATIGLMSAPPEIPRDLVAQTSTALMGFLSNSGTITINMSPPEPLDVGTLIEETSASGEPFAFDKLGLSVEHE